jgi:hypothetical protein
MTEKQITKTKNGNFMSRFKVCEIGVNIDVDPKSHCESKFPSECTYLDSVKHNVNMLSQNEYAQGWVQIIPRRRLFIKRIKNDKDEYVSRISSNIYRMKVNRAQLPPYLYHKLIYNDTMTINHKMYQYNVESTPVDDEIAELIKYTNMSFDEKHRERVYELLAVLKDNDVYGWVVIKATSMYH